MEKKASVCIVATDVCVPGYRGASIHVMELAKVLVNHGHEVHLVSRRPPDATPAYEIIDGIHVHRIYRFIFFSTPFSTYTYRKPVRTSSWYDLVRSMAKSVYRCYLNSLYPTIVGSYVSWLVRKHSLDMIIERETSFGCGALASILSGKKMVLQMNASKCSSISLWQASRILVYPVVLQQLLERGVERDKLVEYFPCVASMFRPDSSKGRVIRDKYGLGDSPIVGYIGIFASWHGIEEILQACRIIHKKDPEVKFLLVGPYYHQWQERCADLDHVIFTGPVDHESVPDYINACNVMLAPFNPIESDLTKNTDFPFIPFKLIEYLACGKPTVSTNVGWIPNILDNDLGILVEPGDVEELASAITSLLHRGSISRQARLRTVRHYSQDRYYNVIARAIASACSS